MDKFNEWFDSNVHDLNTSRIEAEFIFKAGQESRQAEVDESNNRELEALRSWFKEMTLSKEKDKRIEELQAKVDAVEHVLNCAMIAPREVFKYAERIRKALRGEHE